MLIQHGVGIEVVRQGSVMLLDGRHVIPDIDNIDEGRTPELLDVVDVHLHQLPVGSRNLPVGSRNLPGASKAGNSASHIADADPASAPLPAFPENVV